MTQYSRFQVCLILSCVCSPCLFLQLCVLQIANYESKIAMKDDNKTVALGTSKINYMDPRITVAWCKELDVPVEKIFNKSQLSKFPWAMEVSKDWRF